MHGIHRHAVRDAAVADAKRNDPTRTFSLRAKMRAEGDRRWQTLAQVLRSALIEHDIIGQRGMSKLPFGDKTEGFSMWLREELRQKVFGHDGRWLKPYVQQAAAHAQTRATEMLGVRDANPNHDPQTGQFSSGGGDLPTDQASRLKRAKEQGFDTSTKWFHGSSSSFEQFKPTNAAGVWLTQSPETAESYAGISGRSAEEGEQIYPLYIRGRMASNDDWNAAESSLPEGRNYTAHVVEELKRRGFDGFHHQDIAAVFDPKNVRSVHATFDPAKRESARLLDAIVDPSRVTAMESLAVSELAGVCAAAQQQITRAVTHCMMANATPTATANAAAGVVRVMRNRTRGMSEYVVAKTHATSTLSAFRSAGIRRVGIDPERIRKTAHGKVLVKDRPRVGGPGSRSSREETPSASTIGRIEAAQEELESLGEVDVITAGDGDVCPECEDISDEGPYDIDEAEDLIPAHPWCRCAFVPLADERFAEVDPDDEEDDDALDAFDPDQERDPHGRWASSGAGGPGSKELPPKPGTAPIPKGYVRLFHQTSEDKLEGIRQNGITMESARGIEGPRAIYADEKGFYGKPDQVPTVEIAVPKERWDAPFVRADSVLDNGKVAPEDIVAIHYPWHAHAHYIENNPDVLKNVLSGQDNDLLSDRRYGPAIKFIQQKHGTKDFNPNHDPHSGEFTGGEGGGGEASEGEKKAEWVQQIKKQAHSVADDLGFDKSRIDFVHGTRQFDVNGVSHTAAGDADISKGDEGRIRVWLDHVDPFSVRGLTAHEIEHEKFQKAIDSRRRDADMVMKEPGPPPDPTHKYWWGREGGSAAVMSPDGSLKPPYDAKYPFYTAMHMAIDRHNLDDFAKGDGVSDYSAEYWKGVQEGKVSTELATHETLAEMARIKYTTGKFPEHYGYSRMISERLKGGAKADEGGYAPKAGGQAKGTKLWRNLYRTVDDIHKGKIK